jgi:hypothetical protein
MKKYILIIISILSLLSCKEDDPDTNLTGAWHFNEPPDVASRRNRLDFSIPVFDILFEVQEREVVYADLLINADEVSETYSSVDHGTSVDYTFESDNFTLKLQGCKRLGAMMRVTSAEYTFNGSTITYGGLTIARWLD